MQKYPRIIELYSKYVSFDVFIPDEFFNFFRNMFNTLTIEVTNFSFLYKIKQSHVYQNLHIHQGLLRTPHPLIF